MIANIAIYPLFNKLKMIKRYMICDLRHLDNNRNELKKYDEGVD